MNKNPKYDNDLVTLGYLKNTFQGTGEDITDLAKIIPKSYSLPPPPPYYTGSILYYNNCVYRCKKDRTQGNFSWDDWELIISGDDGDFQRWVENTYQVDKLQIEQQIDEKIETYYQSTDPNTWTTDIEKAKHVGDYWYNTTNNTQWRYTRQNTNPVTYAWNPVDVPNAIFDLIDTKKSIYTSKPTSYNEDDLWIIEDTLADEDLPANVEKGDWVFATTNSTTYNKAHWVKRDEDVSLDYLQNHYYTTTEVEAQITASERYTDSEITKAKNEISLNVSQTYTTKTEFNQKVLDYDEEIGEISSIVESHTDSISNLSIDVGEISTTVYNNNETITEELNKYKQEVSTQFTQTKDNFNFKFDSLTQLVDNVSDTESEHYQELHRYIRFVNGVIILGEEGNPLTAELSNSRLSFKQNGTEVAYISNNKLYITSSEITTDLMLGNFGFGPKSNGSLSFRKVR